MAGHHDRPGVLAHRLADGLGGLGFAGAGGDLGIGQGLAGRNGAGDGVDALLEAADEVQVQRDRREVRGLASQQLQDAVPGVQHGRRRRRAGGLGEAAQQPRPHGLCGGFGQADADQAALAPGQAAGADRGLEDQDAGRVHGQMSSTDGGRDRSEACALGR